MSDRIVRGIRIVEGFEGTFEDERQVAYYTEFGVYSDLAAAIADIMQRVSLPTFDAAEDDAYALADRVVVNVGGVTLPEFSV